MKGFTSKEEYIAWLKNLKEKFLQAQLKASVKVNSTLLEFYWELGADIVAKQKKTTWGSGFLKQLSKDLIAEFPEIKGFSKRNLEQIRRWYLFWSKKISIAQQAVAQLENSKSITKQVAPQLDNSNSTQAVRQLFQVPWGHNIVIIEKCKDTKKAFFYVNKTIENGWSRAVLVHQIKSDLYERQGKSINNFTLTLPQIQSDLAKEIIKDPYNFDFLSLGEKYKEQDLEKSLLNHVTDFLLELGSGFALVGRQKALQVGEREFFIDLLFYHTQMYCYVVVELKIVDFEPEFAGKLNFYVKAVDKQIKIERDEPTIGI